MMRFCEIYGNKKDTLLEHREIDALRIVFLVLFREATTVADWHQIFAKEIDTGFIKSEIRIKV